MTSRWTLDTVAWHRFDSTLVDPDLLAVVKAAALIEANAADYVAYLCSVFADDPEFVAAAQHWGIEEEQHGAALGRWAELADPGFRFDAALADFRARYHVPVDAGHSIRGSRVGELIARQVVETGTSSFYSAIRDATREPVLAEVAGRIASDEFFHYRLFARFAERYEFRRNLSFVSRLKVALTRFNEADDDELGYAYFCANILPHDTSADYAARNYGREYWRRAITLYRRPHVDNAIRMILRASGAKGLVGGANGWLFRLGSSLFWRLVNRWRTTLSAT